MGDARKVLPGPADYNTDLATWKKAAVPEMPKCAIPKAYRKFDIIKCKINFLILKILVDGCTSSEIIRKGIY